VNSCLEDFRKEFSGEGLGITSLQAKITLEAKDYWQKYG